MKRANVKQELKLRFHLVKIRLNFKCNNEKQTKKKTQSKLGDSNKRHDDTFGVKYTSVTITKEF